MYFNYHLCGSMFWKNQHHVFFLYHSGGKNCSCKNLHLKILFLGSSSSSFFCSFFFFLEKPPLSLLKRLEAATLVHATLAKQRAVVCEKETKKKRRRRAHLTSSPASSSDTPCKQRCPLWKPLSSSSPHLFGRGATARRPIPGNAA